MTKPYRRGNFTRAERRKQYEHNLSIKDWRQLNVEHYGRCAICRKTPEERGDRAGLSLDHDHRCCKTSARDAKKSCGKCLRGLLCMHCNQGLGKFGDSIDMLERAIDYLAKYGTPD